jgi:hypothetical protein
MKVFNLCCEFDHTFEGWFGSADDYQQQLDNQLLTCPMCNSANVRRLPSAPRLNLSAASSSAPVPSPSSGSGSADQQNMIAPTAMQMQEMLLRMSKHIKENTEDVGERFADEARAIHYQEAPERGIRGKASLQEAAELADEGIEVLPLPLPVSPDEPIQ